MLIILASNSICNFASNPMQFFHGGGNDILAHVTAMFVNMPLIKVTIIWSKSCICLLTWYTAQNLLTEFQVRVGTSKVFGGLYKLIDTGSDDRSAGNSRPRTVHTAKNIIVLMNLCSVRKMHHRHISQYLKFQGILQLDSRQLEASSTTFSQPPIHAKENNVPIWLLIYSWVA